MNVDLRTELRESLQRRGLNPPKKPYRREKPLYVRVPMGPAREYLPKRPHNPLRTTECVDCGATIRARTAEPVCRPCKLARKAKDWGPHGHRCRCGASLADRHPLAKWCHDCLTARKVRQNRESRERRRGAA